MVISNLGTCIASSIPASCSLYDVQSNDAFQISSKDFFCVSTRYSMTRSIGIGTWVGKKQIFYFLISLMSVCRHIDWLFKINEGLPFSNLNLVGVGVGAFLPTPTPGTQNFLRLRLFDSDSTALAFTHVFCAFHFLRLSSSSFIYNLLHPSFLYFYPSLTTVR